MTNMETISSSPPLTTEHSPSQTTPDGLESLVTPPSVEPPEITPLPNQCHSPSKKSSPELEEEMDCPICLMVLEPDGIEPEQFGQIACDTKPHVFHLLCIKKWSENDRIPFTEIKVIETLDGPVIETIVLPDLNAPNMEIDAAPEDDEEDLECMICGTVTADTLILCDICDGGCHLFCVGLDAVPDGEWYCPNCEGQTGHVQPPAPAVAPHQPTSVYQTADQRRDLNNLLASVRFHQSSEIRQFRNQRSRALVQIRQEMAQVRRQRFLEVRRQPRINNNADSSSSSSSVYNTSRNDPDAYLRHLASQTYATTYSGVNRQRHNNTRRMQADVSSPYQAIIYAKMLAKPNCNAALFSSSSSSSSSQTLPAVASSSREEEHKDIWNLFTKAKRASEVENRASLKRGHSDSGSGTEGSKAPVKASKRVKFEPNQPAATALSQPLHNNTSISQTSVERDTVGTSSRQITESGVANIESGRSAKGKEKARPETTSAIKGKGKSVDVDRDSTATQLVSSKQPLEPKTAPSSAQSTTSPKPKQRKDESLKSPKAGSSLPGTKNRPSKTEIFKAVKEFVDPEYKRGRFSKEQYKNISKDATDTIYDKMLATWGQGHDVAAMAKEIVGDLIGKL
ncbi:PHD and RING finger domain-containing protein 1 [Blyttiomyces sp. JEL0837]|nr:PHD and RING finger domain-containing protein 1 [Blyttiomyces sp. JEL0837]